MSGWYKGLSIYKRNTILENIMRGKAFSNRGIRHSENSDDLSDTILNCTSGLFVNFMNMLYSFMMLQKVDEL